MAKKKLRFPKADRLQHLKADGCENVSDKPTEIAARNLAPVSLREKMSNLWKEFREKEQEANQFESIIDAQDFDVSNDVQQKSGYEVDHELDDAVAYQAEIESSSLQDKQGASSDVQSEPVKEESNESN